MLANGTSAGLGNFTGRLTGGLAAAAFSFALGFLDGRYFHGPAFLATGLLPLVATSCGAFARQPFGATAPIVTASMKPPSERFSMYSRFRFRRSDAFVLFRYYFLLSAIGDSTTGQCEPAKLNHLPSCCNNTLFISHLEGIASLNYFCCFLLVFICLLCYGFQSSCYRYDNWNSKVRKGFNL
jgi:hypothetical protein